MKFFLHLPFVMLILLRIGTIAQINNYNHLVEKFGYYQGLKGTNDNGNSIAQFYKSTKNQDFSRSGYSYLFFKEDKIFKMELPEVEGNLKKAGKKTAFTNFALAYKEWFILGVSAYTEAGELEVNNTFYDNWVDQIYFYSNEKNHSLMIDNTQLDDEGNLIRKNLTPYWYPLGDYLYYRTGNIWRRYDGEKSVKWFTSPDNELEYQLFSLNNRIFGYNVDNQKLYLHDTETGERKELNFLLKKDGEGKEVVSLDYYKSAPERYGSVKETPDLKGKAIYADGEYYFICNRRVEGKLRRDIIVWNMDKNTTRWIEHSDPNYKSGDGYTHFLGNFKNGLYVGFFGTSIIHGGRGYHHKLITPEFSREIAQFYYHNGGNSEIEYLNDYPVLEYENEPLVSFKTADGFHLLRLTDEITKKFIPFEYDKLKYNYRGPHKFFISGSRLYFTQADQFLSYPLEDKKIQLYDY